MIITVTLNPALDKTVEVDSLLLGGLNRLRNVTIDAGGKGINVSKMISALGGQSIATGYVGGSSGDELLHRLEKLKIQHSFVSVQDTTRTNLKVVSAEGVTELNEPGVQVTESEHTSLRRKLLSYSAPDTLYVLSGSLPRNADRSLYKTLTQELRSTGAKVFVDADGEALREALLAPPNYIKPNRDELIEYFGAPVGTGLEQLLEMCGQLLSTGVELVVLSMGADGALFVNCDQAFHAPGLKVKVHSTVGAGDSMVGALAYAMQQGLPFEQAAALSVAASAGAVTTTGTNPPDLQTVHKLQSQVVLNKIK